MTPAARDVFAQAGWARELLTLAGAAPVFEVGAYTGQGIQELMESLEERNG